MKRLLLKWLLKPSVQHSHSMQTFRDAVAGTSRVHLLRKIFFLLAWNRVRGDYVEFGVGSGASLANAFFASQYQNAWYPKNHPFYTADRVNAFAKTRFLGFDSFEGLPEATGIDQQFRIFEDGMIACPKDAVQAYLKKEKVDLNRVSLVEGFFSETLTDATRKNLDMGPVAFVLFDADYYQSTIEALEFISPHIVNGTIFLFDDWYLNYGDPQLGVQRAFSEWCAHHPEFRVAPFLDQRTFVILTENVL